jgi:hypothetical protein
MIDLMKTLREGVQTSPRWYGELIHAAVMDYVSNNGHISELYDDLVLLKAKMRRLEDIKNTIDQLLSEKQLDHFRALQKAGDQILTWINQMNYALKGRHLTLDSYFAQAQSSMWRGGSRIDVFIKRDHGLLFMAVLIDQGWCVDSLIDTLKHRL